MAEKSLQSVDFQQLVRRSYTPSPPDWEDHVLYFLMLDRFSDDRENDYTDNNGATVAVGTTPRFTAAQANSATKAAWLNAGRGWCGGTLNGLRSKLGYL